MTRLAASVVASGLIRSAESEGGFGAVLAKGDAQAGSILVILNEKGRNLGVFERVLQPDSRYRWQCVFAQDAETAGDLDAFLERRRRFDPDTWLIELDVASGERFAAEMNSDD
jgi:hypothetical protein